MKSSVFIVLAVQNEAIHAHFRQLAEHAVESLTRQRQRPATILELSDFSLAEADAFALDSRFKPDSPDRVFVFVSDCFVSDQSPFHSTAFAERCAKDNCGERVGLIGIMRHAQRIADIDRTVSYSCPSEIFTREVQHVLERLDFLQKPARISSIPAESFIIRALRNTQKEFRDYFKLRQRVYSIMGYLNQEIEQSRSQLEINEADTHAIHVGAFTTVNQQEKLVGTGRVVINGEENEALRAMFEVMAARDPVVLDRLATPYTLGLPIFQSHYGMNPILREVLEGDLKCGELSRVIVDYEFRGAGLSRLIVQKAIDLALAQGTKRLFLECLDIHVPLYEKLQFRRLEGICGEVVDVGRTMVAMELTRHTCEQRVHRGRSSFVLAEKPLPQALHFLEK
jgi:predicted GNAT family N-acyltransferase